MTPTSVLRTEQITKSYGELVAVDELSLEVVEGEVFGFLGPNGAGKTTAINLICGLLEPDQGRVYIHDRLVTRYNADLRRQVGVCPQQNILWPKLTCLEQLQFLGELYGLSRRAARHRSERLIAEVNLESKANQLAHKLSGGMQRRLNLIMALVHDPEIVILDEPEAGLDPQSRLRVREYIRSMARVKTVIVTTHNMDEADRLSDRVAIIDHGRLLVMDTPQVLKQSVGEGDVIEISLDDARIDPVDLQARLSPFQQDAQITLTGEAVTIRALNALTLLPAIMESLLSAGIKPGDVRLRQNTLEDVFIRLTGRGLRG